VEYIAYPGGANEDKDNENDIDHDVDEKRGGGDGCFLGAVDIRAYEFDMSVL
jgi:hypothetical protein